MYRLLDQATIDRFPFRMLWRSLVPAKMAFFAWEASWIKVLTLDQLKRRSKAFTNRCFLCEEEEETVEHLLVHCQQARML